MDSEDIDQVTLTAALVSFFLETSSDEKIEKITRRSRTRKRPNLERNFEAAAAMLHGQYFPDVPLYDDDLFAVAYICPALSSKRFLPLS